MFILSSTLFSLHIYQFIIQLRGSYLARALPGQSFSNKSISSEDANNKASFAQDTLFAIEVGSLIVLKLILSYV